MWALAREVSPYPSASQGHSGALYGRLELYRSMFHRRQHARPVPSSVGKTKVGGIDLNKARIRWVVEALIALSVSQGPQGFTASDLARQVRLLSTKANRTMDLDAQPSLSLEETSCQEHCRANRADPQIGINLQRTQGNRCACGSKKQSHQTLVSRHSTPAQI